MSLVTSYSCILYKFHASSFTPISGHIVACVAGGIVSAREIKFSGGADKRAAKPRGEWGEGLWNPFSRLRRSLWRLRRQNFISFALAIPPATQVNHIAVVFSFKCQERVCCIWSVQTPGSTCTIKDRSLKTFLVIWTAVIKPLTYMGVEAEWRPSLYRVGLFNKAWDLPPSQFPWETAPDNALSMNNAFQFDLADDRETFSVKFFPSIFSLKSG